MTFSAFLSRYAVLAVVLLPAACTTSNIEDIAPTSLARTPDAPPRPEPRSPDVQDRADVPVLQDDYPNLNVAPQPAAAQFTEAQRRAEAGALAARRDGLGGAARNGRQASDRSEELRRLARTHGERAIEEIEGQ